jgi:hypothetical protein
LSFLKWVDCPITAARRDFRIQGLTKPPELWPSEFWRVAGIAVNMVGVVGFIMVVRVFLKNRNVS